MWEILEGLFLEEDLDCVTEQTVPMCERDDFSDPDRPQRTSVRHVLQKSDNE